MPETIASLIDQVEQIKKEIANIIASLPQNLSIQEEGFVPGSSPLPDPDYFDLISVCNALAKEALSRPLERILPFLQETAYYRWFYHEGKCWKLPPTMANFLKKTAEAGDE